MFAINRLRSFIKTNKTFQDVLNDVALAFCGCIGIGHFVGLPFNMRRLASITLAIYISGITSRILNGMAYRRLTAEECKLKNENSNE